jgi:hypothetical protein
MNMHFLVKVSEPPEEPENKIKIHNTCRVCMRSSRGLQSIYTKRKNYLVVALIANLSGVPVNNRLVLKRSCLFPNVFFYSLQRFTEMMACPMKFAIHVLSGCMRQMRREKCAKKVTKN